MPDLPADRGAPRVAVLMPTYAQARFIARALDSLLAQCFTAWELVVVDDGSPDDTEAAVAPFLGDPRLRYLRRPVNGGLGAALNDALAVTAAPLVAYLPSDDVFHPDHLERLVAALDAQPEAALAYTGVRHHYNRTCLDALEGYSWQPVQVAHRRIAARWVERTELVTDDFARLYWNAVLATGTAVATGAVTCEWVDHPDQTSKVVREPEGGINPYRRRFRVTHPLRFHTSVGNRIDEVEHHRRFRERPPTPLAPDGLRILLVGELAYNAERVLALEERGHRLYGLWMDDPYWYNTVGPVPFGHVEDLPREGWEAALGRVRPDVIYALLNWQAVPFAHRVQAANPGIPFVWHFKEGPFICLEKGTWPQLVELYERADGQIYSSPEMAAWFQTAVPSLRSSAAPALVLDGDLPKRDWFQAHRSRRLSDDDGEVHTVVPGRPIGLHPEDVATLAAHGAHLHFYGDFTQGQWRAWIERSRSLAGERLHLHPNVDQDRWVAELSQYDAGWLHVFQSRNGGELRRADWDDLNYPARIATLALAGLPMLQGDNRGHCVATQALADERGLGWSFGSFEELGAALADGGRDRLAAIGEHVWAQRDDFTFDAHADRLVAFFRAVIERASVR